MTCIARHRLRTHQPMHLVSPHAAVLPAHLSTSSAMPSLSAMTSQRHTKAGELQEVLSWAAGEASHSWQVASSSGDSYTAASLTRPSTLACRGHHNWTVTSITGKAEPQCVCIYCMHMHVEAEQLHGGLHSTAAFS